MTRVSPKKLSVSVRGTTYPIVIGMHLEKQLVQVVEREGRRRIAIIADTTTRRLFGNRILRLLGKSGRLAELLSIPPGERSKNEKTVSAIQHALLKKRFGRDTVVIALGCGVVGDVAGYVAATYLRGVPYIQVPTTLLAMVDSSVGGKVGVDTKYGKNTVGAFWQPSAVIADLRFLEGLPPRELTSGLLEAIKSFFTSDSDGLRAVDALDQKEPLTSPEHLQEIVVRSVRFKSGV